VVLLVVQVLVVALVAEEPPEEILVQVLAEPMAVAVAQ
jgi:hypothetical protein